MLETEKKKYPLYRIGQSRIARRVGTISVALALTSTRRDEDNDHLCVYLKKSYQGLCDGAEVHQGDIIRLENGERLRVICAATAGREMLLHLESTQIFDTGSFDFEEA